MNTSPHDIKPPSIFLRFFRWFCDPALVEDIEGDLTEMFYRDAESKSISAARFKFSLNIMRLFRPGIIKKFGRQPFTQTSPMFRNYFITSIRSLMRSKGFSAINIVGLAVGLATFSMISLYVYHELSFDRYHSKGDRIFRIVENLRTENELLLQSTSSPPMGPRMLKDFPEVENYVRFQKWNLLAQYDDVTDYEPDSYIADSTVFDVFDFKLVKGDKRTALREPYSIVLTQSMATKYFGDEEPLGKMLKMDYDQFKVTGIVADVQENSHFTFSNLISFSTWSKNQKENEQNAWFWNGFHTYVLLRDADAVHNVRSKMKDFIARNIEKGGMYYEDLPLQELSSIYMAPQRSWENGMRGSLNNVYILSIIAVFILLIACFNYINLATARASRRLKEVGLRKSLGALRRMLVAQFLGESIIVAFIAAVLAVMLTWAALPAFRILIESPLNFSVLPNPLVITAVAVALVLLIGVFAGAYPALIISGFQPLQIFKPSTKGVYSHQNFRKVLVATQFVISIMLVAGTLLIYDQLDLVRNQDLGFNKNAVLIVPTNGDTAIVKHLDAVKNELKNVRGVKSVSGSSTVPGQSTTNLYTEIEMMDGKLSPTNINFNFVDHDFLSTYDIELIAGRDFLREAKADDTTAYLINETAVRDFGWTPEQAIGKRVSGRYQGGKIIGVVKDFHYRSLHTRVEPLLLALTTYVGKIAFRIDDADLTGTVNRVQAKWQELIPYLPFNYSFLDVDFDRQYKADQQLGKVAGVFTGLAIFIGCLGLLGLTSFVVERRTKEIGIRKVLGASVVSVVMLITREFIWLIAVALIVATPVTWYLIREWEQNFTLQAPINPVQFAIAGLAVFVFTSATISFLSLKAATSNPTKALRTE
ncbi:ABC transporter permease [Pseudochryseolinea flava]|uniref:ABC transporter permease n=1 Tax=Pseudochryseolinea flava TaxID=2059302 RepID=A0A364Y186_9BACT|nr:ABC transporter permease [Pseudochryseolinea flava]RAW00378.1 ABC transporter permease [Pseudochryseolinea flava]